MFQLPNKRLVGRGQVRLIVVLSRSKSRVVSDNYDIARPDVLCTRERNRTRLSFQRTTAKAKLPSDTAEYGDIKGPRIYAKLEMCGPYINLNTSGGAAKYEKSHPRRLLGFRV